MNMNHTRSFVTLSGVPLSIELRWPFHKSTSGGDFDVLHGVVTLADGSGLHANVSVHRSAAIRELNPSLEREHWEPVVVNALRKWTDRKELEFIQSTKLQPLPLSSRFLHFKTKQWKFEEASDEQLAQLIKDRLYWTAVKASTGSVAISDPIELLYTGATAERAQAAAQKLVSEGWATLAEGSLTPTAKLSAASAEFEQRAAGAYEAIRQKHAFEAAKKS